MMTEQTFSPAQDAFVSTYMAERKGQAMELDRIVTQPNDLSPEEMMTVLAHPGLEDRALEVMADYMRPQDSMYFDAIFGANYGQQDIRGWLLPAMAEIPFISFVPQKDSVTFDTAAGAAMIDEWQMVATFGDMEIPMAYGISVRRFEDGWMTWVADIYDTLSSRTPPPPGTPMPPMPEGMTEPPQLPDYPEMNWPTIDAGEPEPLTDTAASWAESRLQAHGNGESVATLNEASGLSHDELHALHNNPGYAMNPNLIADMMQPTGAVYVDSLFGRFEGQAAIRSWLSDILPKMGNIGFEPIAKPLWDGNTAVQLWKQMALLPDGSKVEMTWGASVRRFKDGWLVYAADYFDAFSMQKPEVLAASSAIGSTITLEDIMKYRSIQQG